MSIGARLPARCCFWLAVGLVLASPSCRKGAPPKKEPEAELARTRCASACATLASCAGEDSTLERQARCLEQCALLRSEAERAGCDSALDRALGCVSTARIACEKQASVRSALEQGSGLDGCQAEFTDFLRCNAPCREAGVVRSATRRLAVAGRELEVNAEQVSLGCGPPDGTLERKAPPDSPCQHFSVCTPVRCPCPGSNAAYTARVCVDGHCANAELACQLGPSAVGYEPCKGR